MTVPIPPTGPHTGSRPGPQITVPLEPCCGVFVGEEHDCPAFFAEMVAAFANPIRWDVTAAGVEAQR